MDIEEIKRSLSSDDTNEKIEILNTFCDILDSYNKNIPMLDEIIQFLIDLLVSSDDPELSAEILETICCAQIFQNPENVDFDSIEMYMCNAPEELLPRLIDVLAYTHDLKYASTIRKYQFHHNEQVRNSVKDAMVELTGVNAMTNAITNWHVLTGIFGKNFQFADAVIDYMKSEPLDGDVSIDFITESIVQHPPARWERWDKVCIRMEFFFVKRQSCRIGTKPFIVRTFSVRKQEDAFCLEIGDAHGNVIEFDFGAARVQYVRPMVYNEEFGRYEAIQKKE